MSVSYMHSNTERCPNLRSREAERIDSRTSISRVHQLPRLAQQNRCRRPRLMRGKMYDPPQLRSAFSPFTDTGDSPSANSGYPLVTTNCFEASFLCDLKTRSYMSTPGSSRHQPTHVPRSLLMSDLPTTTGMSPYAESGAEDVMMYAGILRRFSFDKTPAAYESDMNPWFAKPERPNEFRRDEHPPRTLKNARRDRPFSEDTIHGSALYALGLMGAEDDDIDEACEKHVQPSTLYETMKHKLVHVWLSKNRWYQPQ